MANFFIRSLAIFCILNILASTRGDSSEENASGGGGAAESTDDCTCGDRNNPICGSDGNKYQNLCFFTCGFKKNRKLKMIPCGGKVTSAEAEAGSGSESGSSEENAGGSCNCPRSYMNPVCGSNGLTYPSKCLLKCATKRVSGLRVKSEGRCPVRGREKSSKPGRPRESQSCFCSKKSKPVCGSDGKQYQNKCILKCARKKNPDLKLAKHEDCAEGDGGAPQGRTYGWGSGWDHHDDGYGSHSYEHGNGWNNGWNNHYH